MRRLWVTGLLVVLVVAGLLRRVASHSPDGLDRVAGDHGFRHTEQTQSGLLGDYSSLGGVIGVLVVLLLMTGLVILARRRRSDRHG